jgi:hypothetical protein
MKKHTRDASTCSRIAQLSSRAAQHDRGPIFHALSPHLDFPAQFPHHSTTTQEDHVLKQQTISTALGPVTVSSLTLGELRQLDSLFQDSTPASGGGITSMLKYLPVIFGSARKIHQDMTLDQLENGLTFDDFNALFSAVLEVSGLKKASAGEPLPVLV